MVTSQLREAKKHIVPLSMACPHLAMETCAVVECAMAYDPTARFTSYDELIEALNCALMVVTTRDKNIRKGIVTAPRPPVAHAVTAADRRRLIKKQRNQKIISTVSLLLVLAIAAWAIITVTGKKDEPITGPSNTPILDDAPVINDSSGVEIGNLYQQARRHQDKGDYQAAHRAFSELLNNPRVQEPTRTWCGFEALLASLLDGNSRTAREDARQLITHLKQDQIPAPTRNRLTPWLEKMREMPHIPQPLASDRPENDLIYLMTSMASGCKNWEQGKIDESLPFFEIVNVTPSKQAQSLIDIYQSKARDYLADAKKLKSNDPFPLPLKPDECRAKAKSLDEVVNSLATRGRAKFNIRAWQLDLERQAKILENEASRPDPELKLPFAENLDAIYKNINSFRFRDALDVTKKTTHSSEKERKQREALIALCEGARNFLRDLEQDVKKSPVTISLQSKDGRNFTQVIHAGDGMVTLAAGPSEASLAWTMLKPADVITLYREAIKRNSSDPNISRRHEDAICFQWLSGEKDAAVSAAAVLGNSSPTFKKRWTDWMDALK
jgi:hypothetical protein